MYRKAWWCFRVPPMSEHSMHEDPEEFLLALISGFQPRLEAYMQRGEQQVAICASIVWYFISRDFEHPWSLQRLEMCACVSRGMCTSPFEWSSVVPVPVVELLPGRGHPT